MEDEYKPEKRMDRRTLQETVDALERVVERKREQTWIYPDPTTELLEDLKDELNKRG